MSGGGGTPGSNQTQEPWANAKEPMIDVINQGASLFSTPYVQYTGQQVANPSDFTQLTNEAAYQRISNGASDLNAARGMAQDVSNGAYFNSPGMNANVSSARNPYAGSNTYLDDMIANNASNMSSAFATGTAAQNDAMAARAGAFGGSAWQQKQQQDAAALAQQVGQMATQNRFQDYTAQQGLAESAINRDTQNQQYNTGMQQSAYQQSMGNMLQGGQLAGSLSQDDYASLNLGRTLGNDQNAYEQKLLDTAQGEWAKQMAFPYQQLSGMGNLLSQFSGYGTSNVQSSPYQASNAATAAGLLGMGAGLYGAYKG